MALSPPVRLRVDDSSGVAPVRRGAARMARALGLSRRACSETEIVATELATNLMRHAGGGEVILRPGAGKAPAMDVIAWDRGPGIRDIGKARRDGFSTASGAGTGLGAIIRLSRSFDVQAGEGQGTVIAARTGDEDASPHVDGLALAMAGEQACGDAWAHHRQGEWLTLVLADGLGHGDDAARASITAARMLDDSSPGSQVELMHEALRKTRGAAVAVARVNLHTGVLRFAGVGNVAASINDGVASKSLASVNGTVGHRVAHIREYDYEVPPGALIVLHSDGCRGGWRLPDYPGLLRRTPLVVASILIRDFERGRDDVSVVVARRPADAA